MFALGMCATIALAVYWLFFWNEQWYRVRAIDRALRVAMTMVFGTIASLLFALIVSTILAPDIAITSPLVALADGGGTSGTFFLGSGSIHSDPAFFWYEQHDNGSYTLEHQDAYFVTIREISNGEQPHMVRYCDNESAAPAWVYWPVPSGAAPASCDGNHDKITFYVPQGSIKSNYILDAQ